jgi:hypothetical protein
MAEGAQATAEAAATGTGAGQQTPAAAGGAGASAGQGGQDDGFVRVSKAEYEAAKANDGRFRQLQQTGDLDFLRDLNGRGIDRKELKATLEHLYGEMTKEQFNAFLKEIRTPAQQQQAGGRSAGQQQAATDPDSQPMTRAEFRAEQARLKAEAEAEAKTNQETQTTAQAEQAAATFWADTAKDLKIKDGAQARAFRGVRDDAVTRIIAEDIQKHDPLCTPERAQQLAGDFIPNKEQLARARAAAEADWKDLGNIITSEAADGQHGMPAGTLGGGAGSAQHAAGPPRSQAEAMKAVVAQVKANFRKQ